MKELFNKKSIINFLILPVFAIGSFYDERLGVSDLNFTYFFSAMFVIALLFVLLKKGNKIINTNLVFLFSIIFIFNLINWLLWGINEYEGYSENKLIVLFLITLPVCIFVNKFKSEDEIIIFLKQMSLIGLLLAALGSVQIIAGGGGESRLAVFGGGPIVFSRWVGMFFIVFLYSYNLKKMYKIPILLMCLTLMLFSGSKGPFFFLLLTVFIINVRSKKIVSFVLFVYLIIKFNLDFIIKKLSFNPMLVRVFGLDESSSITEGTSSTGRITLLKDSFISIYENPFGYGLGNFSIYSDLSKTLEAGGYPHNFFIEIFVELGIFVLIIALSYFIFLFKELFKSLYKESIKLTDNYKTILSLWVFYLLNSMVSGDLSDARFLIVFTLLYFLHLKLKKQQA